MGEKFLDIELGSTRVKAVVIDEAAKFGARPTRFDAMGVSAMMHGYLAFGQAMHQLAPFRPGARRTLHRPAKVVPGVL